MTKTMDEVRAQVIERIKLLCKARDKLSQAGNYVGEAEFAVGVAWEGWPLTYKDKHKSCDAINTFIELASADIKRDLMAAAEQFGKLMARDVIAPFSRESSEPVRWLTGNSFMPPLRSLWEAEQLWQADDEGDVWETFCESLENQLQTENVLMTCPEYDNALYCVDLARWEHIENSEGADNLNDEWQVRT